MVNSQANFSWGLYVFWAIPVSLDSLAPWEDKLSLISARAKEIKGESLLFPKALM